jgi:hypothetical protein
MVATDIQLIQEANHFIYIGVSFDVINHYSYSSPTQRTSSSSRRRMRRTL